MKLSSRDRESVLSRHLCFSPVGNGQGILDMPISRMVGLALTGVIAATMVCAADANAARKHQVVVLDGVAAMHNIVRIGNRLCFEGHYHYGSSAGQATKAAAQSAAIDSWFQLVDLEYGAEWSSFRKSANKKVTCSQSTSGWGCDVESIPCR
jgi:hypothetical protein